MWERDWCSPRVAIGIGGTRVESAGPARGRTRRKRRGGEKGTRERCFALAPRSISLGSRCAACRASRCRHSICYCRFRHTEMTDLPTFLASREVRTESRSRRAASEACCHNQRHSHGSRRERVNWGTLVMRDDMRVIPKLTAPASSPLLLSTNCQREVDKTQSLHIFTVELTHIECAFKRDAPFNG